jgi:hypothetical protein
MNRFFLATALIVSLQGKLCAQTEETKPCCGDRMGWTKTQQTFNTPQMVSIRDYVYLQNGGKMIVELTSVEDFDKLKNLDSLIRNFIKDISFYKDSLEGSAGNVRIDYVVHANQEHREIRFKKYRPDGDIYVSKYGEISKLKIEEDTIRILLHVQGKEIMTKFVGLSGKRPKKKVPYTPQYQLQITFCLNNYTDINKLIAGPAMLRHIIDTLQSTKKEGTVNDPYKFPSSSIFKPYQGGERFRRFGGLINSDKDERWRNVTRRNDLLTANVNFGAGIVRNTLAPIGEFGISYENHRRRLDAKNYTVVSLYMSSVFFFDRDPNGGYFVKDNWFLNADIGAPGDGPKAANARMFSIGAGYLVAPKGDYFKGTTMKVFAKIQFQNGISVCPELIITNDFKQVFPGLTLKIF